MATNRYFSQGTTAEKRLYEDIIIEALSMYGQDVYYLPREIVNRDTIFSDDAVSYLSKIMGDSWHDYLYTNVINLRTLSLRYRSTEYFEALLQELKKSRMFRRYWREVYFEEKDHYIDNEYFRVNSPQWGRLVWFTSSLTALTTAGELQLMVYVPASKETSKAFSQIERNMEQFAILNDEIRNPLQAIVGLAELEGGDLAEKIFAQAKEIDGIIKKLDLGYMESQKIREFLRKHYSM